MQSLDILISCTHDLIAFDVSVLSLNFKLSGAGLVGYRKIKH